MEPKMEQPKQYTPEEIADIKKERTISDAEFLRKGARYIVDEEGNEKNLLLHAEQKSHEKYIFEKKDREYEHNKKVMEQRGINFN